MQVVEKKLTTPVIPKQSPIQVLNRANLAWLSRADEVGHVQGGLAVSDKLCEKCALYRGCYRTVPLYNEIIGLRG